MNGGKRKGAGRKKGTPNKKVDWEEIWERLHSNEEKVYYNQQGTNREPNSGHFISSLNLDRGTFKVHTVGRI